MGTRKNQEGLRGVTGFGCHGCGQVSVSSPLLALYLTNQAYLRLWDALSHFTSHLATPPAQGLASPLHSPETKGNLAPHGSYHPLVPRCPQFPGYLLHQLRIRK